MGNSALVIFLLIKQLESDQGIYSTVLKMQVRNTNWTEIRYLKWQKTASFLPKWNQKKSLFFLLTTEILATNPKKAIRS